MHRCDGTQRYLRYFQSARRRSRRKPTWPEWTVTTVHGPASRSCTIPAKWSRQGKTVPKSVPIAWMTSSSPPAERSESETLPDGMQSRLLLDWGIEDVGPALDALDVIALAQLSLSMSKALHKEYRAPFAPHQRHALRLFIQTHDAVVVPTNSSLPPPDLVLKLERAIKLLHITLALLQSSDDRCSRQGRCNAFARGKLGSFNAVDGGLRWLTATTAGRRHTLGS